MRENIMRERAALLEDLNTQLALRDRVIRRQRALLLHAAVRQFYPEKKTKKHKHLHVSNNRFNKKVVNTWFRFKYRPQSVKSGRNIGESG